MRIELLLGKLFGFLRIVVVSSELYKYFEGKTLRVEIKEIPSALS